MTPKSKKVNSTHQTIKTKNNDRKDHVWKSVMVEEGDAWKCVLCGAITIGKLPPSHPTPETWMPLRYEKLTNTERESDMERIIGGMGMSESIKPKT